MKKSITTIQSFLIIIIITTLISLTPTVSGDPRAQKIALTCGTSQEHNRSVFVTNFISTMQNISDQINEYSGFGTAASGGSGPDANYGLAQCYGDLTGQDCVLCYAAARTVLPQCFPYSSGRVYLDGCFMRSDNYSFFPEFLGAEKEDRVVCGNITINGSTRSAAGGFLEASRRAVARAAAGAPVDGGYARAQVRVKNESAYVLADCWKTLNESACKACLDKASEAVLGCLPLSEGRALYTGCFFRYSDTDFLNKVAREKSAKGKIIVIVASVVGSVTVLVVGAVIGICMWKHRNIVRKQRGSNNDTRKLAKILNASSLNFKYSTLEKATGCFDSANKLGQGGYGTVYKGVLGDGREIAVKRLYVNNMHRAADFYNEVNIVSGVEHKNLVRLLGCSCSGPESLLVYEFLPNKSLDCFIFDSNRGKALNWDKRCEIMIGTAEGLAYLHENSTLRIIHRDIKASNILLDIKLGPKIADFGLARSFEDDKSHISTVIAGTLGYMAPEYLAHGQLTEKADVYSFGVLLLEIVTGRQNNRSIDTEFSDSLVTTVWKHFNLGTGDELFDSNIMLHDYYHDSRIKNEVLRVMHIGLLCTQESATLRPSMSRVMQWMRKKDEKLPLPTNPPFVDDRTMELNDSSSEIVSFEVYAANRSQMFVPAKPESEST